MSANKLRDIPVCSLTLLVNFADPDTHTYTNSQSDTHKHTPHKRARARTRRYSHMKWIIVNQELFSPTSIPDSRLTIPNSRLTIPNSRPTNLYLSLPKYPFLFSPFRSVPCLAFASSFLFLGLSLFSSHTHTG